MITIPTIAQLYDLILADLQAEYGTSIPTFGKNFLRVVAAVQAGKMKLMYLAIGDLQKNIFVDTATPESAGGTLERFGRVKLNRNPFPAVAGQYTVSVTGTTGSVIPAQQQFKSDDTSTSPGILFILDVAKQLSAPTDTMLLRALTVGLGGRLSIGDTLTAVSPIAGVSSVVTVTVETVEPVAAEDLEDYRRKALDAYRQEPQGGAATDYRLWAADAQGVEQTYPYAKTGASNEINVYVEATTVDSVDGQGTPSAALLQRVSEVIEFDPDVSKPQSERGRRPLGVLEVHVLPVTVRQIDITIPSYANLTAEIQLAIQDALEEMINNIRPFIPACDVIEEKNDILDVNKIISTILISQPGASFGTVQMEVDNFVTSSFQFTLGNIPHLNVVLFT